jgi:hypothetical protein
MLNDIFRLDADAPHRYSRWITAMHEAGHAVVGLHVGFWPQALRVGTANGGLGWARFQADTLPTEARWGAGMVAIAGAAAESIVTPDDIPEIGGPDLLVLERLGLDDDDSRDLLHVAATEVIRQHRRLHFRIARLAYDTGYVHGDDMIRMFTRA